MIIVLFYLSKKREIVSFKNVKEMPNANVMWKNICVKTKQLK